MYEARWRLGELRTTDMPDAAVALIQARHECDALWQLTGAYSQDLPVDGQVLFERALRELRRDGLDTVQAPVVVAPRRN